MKTVCKIEETGDFCAGANFYQVWPFHNSALILASEMEFRGLGGKKTALYIGLEVGSFKSFLVVDLEFLATRTEKGVA